MKHNTIKISKSVYDTMMEIALDADPREAGGLLCGQKNRNQYVITHFIPSFSNESGPYSFSTVPEMEQPKLNRLHAGYDCDFQGYHHTHLCDSGPSSTDLQTSESLYYRMKKHNGTTPIMGLSCKTKKGWKLKMYAVEINSGEACWNEIPFQIIPDQDWSMRDIIRPKSLSGGTVGRIFDELNLLVDVFGDDVRFRQEGSCFDADVPFKNGILRIRISERYPHSPPRLWFCDESGTWHNCYHLWMSMWNDSFTLWEMIDCTKEFVCPPWQKEITENEPEAVKC
ncbi:MAG: hypothetical protein HOC71_08230 [Candidatus Latescibacteria bacterium]|jgi:hypothetical protein|nr:hypothetical protein [Candidatus Latescibacterota bacterium]